VATDAPYGADGEHPLPADIAAAIQAIRADREHGASWLARAAARALRRAGDPRDDVPLAAWDTVIRAAAQELVAARPSMAAVANAAATIWNAGQSERSPSARRQAMLAMAARLASQEEPARQAMLAHAEKLIKSTVYTMSRSGTVEDILRQLGQQHIIERVIVAESRPGGEGVALARALARSGLPVMVVADTACGIFIAEAACVVLGADSLRADGSLVNKVGSYPLALAAREAGKPVYVLCETLKIAAPDFPLALEEMNPAEVLPGAEAGLTARNPYFDVTPATLIAAYITEDGVLDRDAIARRAQAAGDALARLRAG
jgi:translation initiation factor 2B subunit (eIF-2B alpha/beta/delta family)